MGTQLAEVIEIIDNFRDSEGIIFIQTEKVKSRVCAILHCTQQEAERLVAMAIKVRNYNTDIIAMVPYIYDGI